MLNDVIWTPEEYAAIQRASETADFVEMKRIVEGKGLKWIEPSLIAFQPDQERHPLPFESSSECLSGCCSDRPIVAEHPLVNRLESEC